MSVVNAAFESKEPQAAKFGQRREPTDLDLRYGKIGISAVAAAARYVEAGKKPAGVPPMAPIDQRFFELAP